MKTKVRWEEEIVRNNYLRLLEKLYFYMTKTNQFSSDSPSPPQSQDSPTRCGQLPIDQVRILSLHF